MIVREKRRWPPGVVKTGMRPSSAHRRSVPGAIPSRRLASPRPTHVVDDRVSCGTGTSSILTITSRLCPIVRNPADGESRAMQSLTSRSTTGASAAAPRLSHRSVPGR